MDSRELDERIRSRGVPGECPGCGSSERSLVKPPVVLVAATEEGHVTFDPDAVTATFCGAVVCENCGLVRLHALAPLGMSLEP
jgi:hypothetical protein